MDKCISFEEWDNETFVRNIAKFDEAERRACFEAARRGMIPADRAVEIPDVSEWPEWATSVVTVWSRQKEKWTTEISRISKLVPAWVPKDWEPVIFAKPEDDTTLHGVYFGGEIHYGDLYYTARGMRYTKFDPAKIGRPWSEI